LESDVKPKNAQLELVYEEPPFEVVVD